MDNLFDFEVKSAFSVKSGSDAFVCRTIPDALLDKIAALQPQTVLNRRRALLLTTAFSLSMLVMILLPLGIIVLRVRFSAVLRNAPWAYALEGTAVAVWFSILLYALQYKKRSRSFSPFGEQTAAERRLTEACKAALGIPADAAVVDVLAAVYTVGKDGRRHYTETTLFGAPRYHNLPTPIFADTEALYLSDFTRLLRIPLASVERVTTLQRRVVLQNWNKEVSPHAARYRAFGLRRSFRMKAYCCQVEIHDPRGRYCLLIPNYDLPTFLQTANPERSE